MKLGDIGTFTKGAPLSKADISEKGTPFILYGELYTTYDEVTYEIKRKTDKIVSETYYSKIGDVIIPTSGETPEEIATATCVMLPDVILAGDLNIYRTSAVDGRIVSFIINHVINDKISKVAQGKSVVHVKAEEIGKISINYPNAKEQKKILSFLELLDKKIDKQKQLVESLKSYKRGVMRCIFREKSIIFSAKTKWSSVRLGDECTFFSGGTPKSTESSYYGGNIPFIRSGEIHSDKTELFLTTSGLSNSSAKLVHKGDLIIALYGATSGEVDISKIDGAINQAILCVRPSNVNTFYLRYLMEDSKDDIINTYLQGGQGNLSAEIIKDLRFDIPDDNTQSFVVDFLAMIDRKIEFATAEYEQFQSMKDGLLQQLFI